MKRKGFYQFINEGIKKMGFDIRRFPSKSQHELLKYLEKNNVNTCFDVGANIGQYGQFVRSIGYAGKIISFEPQKKAFAELKKKAAKDATWEVYNIGLGDWDGNSVINISENSVSSSILDISEMLVNTISETTYVAVEDIVVNRLDTFVCKAGLKDNFFLKIDAQGFESKILKGTEACFGQVYALQLELAFITLYKEEKLFDEMKKNIEDKGFYISHIESNFSNPNDGRLLQADVIFLREI